MQLELKKWTLEDAEALMRICNGADRSYLRNQMPFPYTIADAEFWLKHLQECEGSAGVFRAIVVDGEYVGNISIDLKDDVYIHDAEIGFLLLTDHWGKGIMTQATREICAMAFEALDIARITGLVNAPNIASRRVLEKNGFTLEGIMKNAIFKNGAFQDECIYGLLK